jgi:hypothetical protein
MESCIRSGDLSTGGLLELLQVIAFPAGETVRCYLAAPDGWAFDYWPGTEGNVRWNRAARSQQEAPVGETLARLTEGRLFAPSGELRWRNLPINGPLRCRTVFLGRAVVETPGLEDRSHLESLTPHRQDLLLWGQQTSQSPGEWIELRIPHRLVYPVEVKPVDGGRIGVKLNVEVWTNRSGEPAFQRLCDLTAFVED